MDLRYTDEEVKFRNELRHFFQNKIPKTIRDKVSAGASLTKEEMITSQRILNGEGLAVPHWPVEWGGRDWTPIQRYIFTEEILYNAVPLPLQFNCFMVGPVIATFGSQAQKERFLKRVANLDDWWCQGFSEPGAGSDLASLKMRAVREGDHYIVNGQKTWTTLGQYADWIFCLVRTDPNVKKQAGISFILVDMKTPGITVRPIITIDGRHEVNEIFFSDVKVPIENLVGEENKGWSYAKFLLANERSGIARLGLTKERVSRIKRLAKTVPFHDRTMWENPGFRERLAWLEIELKALEITQMRVLSKQVAGNKAPDPASSILKIKGSELQQLSTELLEELAGPLVLNGTDAPVIPDGFDWVRGIPALYMNTRKVSIYGGSNEIQHNVIAKAILGL
ncbi:acyl-CoA dehydrogenase family protein [uncultured Bartonella sp.]|uniref:acyl-CoA dehydrogenase family protein n=1 Tax=uncultured Bartonella sp. TaxID=104108 RepID=UPI0026059CF5|nr:acyl-CoA dehydrogenase family protein [uncultured Bartonella sp.]